MKPNKRLYSRELIQNLRKVSLYKLILKNKGCIKERGVPGTVRDHHNTLTILFCVIRFWHFDDLNRVKAWEKKIIEEDFCCRSGRCSLEGREGTGSDPVRQRRASLTNQPNLTQESPVQTESPAQTNLKNYFFNFNLDF